MWPHARRNVSIATAFGCWLAVSIAFLGGATILAAEQKPMTFQKKIAHRVELDYLLYLPAGYDQDRERDWPLVLFLHGAGERGADLELLKKHGPPKLLAAGQDLPAIVVSPQCPANQWWTDHLEALTALLDDAGRRHRVDPDRVYVTGISMGGYGTWALVGREPQRFAAAIPICGGGNRLGLVRAADLPIWAFHGEADPVVPLDETTRLVDALKRRGGGAAVKLTTYPGVGHDSWTQTYDDPAVWEWLFAQRRRAPAAPAAR